jgi:hypothetical protein
MLSFTVGLNAPIRLMVGSHCDNVLIVKETKNTITLSIRPGSLSSERLTITKRKPAEFYVKGHSVKVVYWMKKSGGFQLCFEATQWVKIYGPHFIGIR